MLEERQVGVATAEDALAGLVEDAETLEEASELVTRHGAIASKLEERTSRLSAADATHDALGVERETAAGSCVALRADASAAEEALTAAIAAEVAARTALDRARHENMAHTLRGTLSDGEACPVCAQPVATIPPSAEISDVDDAAGTLAAAEQRLGEHRERSQSVASSLTAAETKLDALDGQLATAVEELGALRTDVAATRSDLEDTLGRLVELLGPGDPTETLQQRRAAISNARDSADAARKELERVRIEHDQAIRDEQTADKRIADVRLTAARVASALDVELDLGSDDPQRLAEAIALLRSNLDDESAGLTTEQGVLGGELGELSAARTELLASVAVSGDLGVEIAGVGAKVETLSGQIELVEKDLAAQEDDRTQLSSLELQKSHFDRIVTDLTDAKFVRYLLDDERIRLADLSSDHFQRLSSGRYRFSDDGKFEIIDLATADAVRKADSLSGGETFLASLALALGLAEMVARSGGRLEAFFLDEGFGTLDPEHLHLAMEGIERLVTDGSSRLVVVVSHVPELRQRLEDLIELDKDPLTGDTVVLRA